MKEIGQEIRKEIQREDVQFNMGIAKIQPHLEDELRTATIFHDALRYRYDRLRCTYDDLSSLTS